MDSSVASLKRQTKAELIRKVVYLESELGKCRGENRGLDERLNLLIKEQLDQETLYKE